MVADRRPGAGSAIGLYYYLRVMVTLFLVEPGIRQHDAPFNWGQRAGGIMLVAIALLAFFLGVYPQPLLEILQHSGLASPAESPAPRKPRLGGVFLARPTHPARCRGMLRAPWMNPEASCPRYRRPATQRQLGRPGRP